MTTTTDTGQTIHRTTDGDHAVTLLDKPDKAVTATVFRSELDSHPVVQIDSEVSGPTRVIFGESTIFEGDPEANRCPILAAAMAALYSRGFEAARLSYCTISGDRVLEINGYLNDGLDPSLSATRLYGDENGDVYIALAYLSQYWISSPESTVVVYLNCNGVSTVGFLDADGTPHPRPRQGT